VIIALLLAAAAPAVDGTPLGVLAPQALPAKGCAAYLFTADGTRRFVAMAAAEDGRLRVVLDGATVDAARGAQTGALGFGFAASTEYRGQGFVATLELTTTPRPGLTGGATIPEATLRIDRAEKDGIAVPLVGLIGCATF
jgi:hypothetical protein